MLNDSVRAVVSYYFHSYLTDMDQNVYPNPDRYDPERFLTKDGRLSIGENDPKKITFGFGRRYDGFLVPFIRAFASHSPT